MPIFMLYKWKNLPTSIGAAIYKPIDFAQNLQTGIFWAEESIFADDFAKKNMYSWSLDGAPMQKIVQFA